VASESASMERKLLPRLSYLSCLSSLQFICHGGKGEEVQMFRSFLDLSQEASNAVNT
jgi:hypothetical protein